jgi:ribose 5-phosphate isomerase A
LRRVTDPLDPAEAGKRAVAEAAAELVSDGMAVGLGTGSTVAFLLPALARRGPEIRCIATSPATAEAATQLGLAVEKFDDLSRLDIAIDGADQVAADRWVIKGGGGAHLREKVAAAAADRFVVIVDESKVVESLGPPVPLELLAFGLPATRRRLAELGQVERRDVPLSPDGGVIADLHVDLGDRLELGERLDSDPGVLAHGLFPGPMVSDVLVGSNDGQVTSLT